MEKANAILNKQMNNKKEEKKEEERRIERQRREEREDRKEQEKNREENTTIVTPNVSKVHQKRNKPVKYEFGYEEIPIEYETEENNFDE